MAKGNLQAQARDLVLPDDGSAVALRKRISDTGQEPNDDYDSSYSDSEEVTRTGETVEVEGESAGAVGARTEEDPTSVEQSEEDAQAAAVVILNMSSEWLPLRLPVMTQKSLGSRKSTGKRDRTARRKIGRKENRR